MFNIEKSKNDEFREFVRKIENPYTLEDIRLTLMEINASSEVGLYKAKQDPEQKEIAHKIKYKIAMTKLKLQILSNWMSELKSLKKAENVLIHNSKERTFNKAIMACFDDATKREINRQFNKKFSEFENIVEQQIKDIYY